MDRNIESLSFLDIPPEAPSTPVALSKSKSKNAFYVFGNIYVTNQSENSNKQPENSASENNMASNLNEISSELNIISDKMRINQSLLMELKQAIEKREKRKARREKAENDRDTVKKAEESVDFFHPNSFQPRVQDMKNQWEELLKRAQQNNKK